MDGFPDEIIALICRFIDCGSGYKAMALSSKRMHTIISAVWPDADTRFANHLKTLIKMRAVEPWDQSKLCVNPSLDINFLKNIVPADLFNANIHKNPAVSWAQLLDEDIPWDKVNPHIVNMHSRARRHFGRGHYYRNIVVIMPPESEIFGHRAATFLPINAPPRTWKDCIDMDVEQVSVMPFDAQI